MNATQTTRTTATAAPVPPTTTAAPATQGAGADLDGFLDMSAKPGEQPGIVATTLADLGAGFKQIVAGAIDRAAPAAGTEMELAATLHCPIEPPLFLAGKLSIKAARATSGAVTASLAGGIGPALGDGVAAFVDLLGTTSLQGEAADPLRAVDMLLLALESHVRAISNSLLLSLCIQPSNPSLTAMMAPVVAISLATGYGIGDVIADMIWGVGHAGAVKAAMRDGEAAQRSVGATIGGSTKAPSDLGDIGFEISAGASGRERIEKTAGQATTTTPQGLFTLSGGLSIGPIAFSGELEAEMKKGGSFKVTAAGKGTLEAGTLGEITPYIEGFVGIISGLQTALANKSTEAPEDKQRAQEALLGFEAPLRGAATAAHSAFLLELGKAGLPVKGTFELGLEFDLVARTVKLQPAISASLEGEIPGGTSGSVTQKLLLGEPFTFTV